MTCDQREDEIEAIAIACEQLRPAVGEESRPRFSISAEGIWRTLNAPRLPIHRPLLPKFIETWTKTGEPIYWSAKIDPDVATVGLAGAHVYRLLDGLEALSLHPKLNTREIKSQLSVSRQLAALSRRVNDLHARESKEPDDAERQALFRERSKLNSQTFELFSQRAIKRDRTGSARERFIGNHLVAAFEPIYRQPARHSTVGREKNEVGGPFVRFACTFCEEVGLTNTSAHCVAAALDRRRVQNRKASSKAPQDSSWIETYFPKSS